MAALRGQKSRMLWDPGSKRSSRALMCPWHCGTVSSCFTGDLTSASWLSCYRTSLGHRRKEDTCVRRASCHICFTGDTVAAITPLKFNAKDWDSRRMMSVSIYTFYKTWDSNRLEAADSAETTELSSIHPSIIIHQTCETALGGFICAGKIRYTDNNTPDTMWKINETQWCCHGNGGNGVTSTSHQCDLYVMCEVSPQPLNYFCFEIHSSGWHQFSAIFNCNTACSHWKNRDQDRYPWSVPFMNDRFTTKQVLNFRQR